MSVHAPVELYLASPAWADLVDDASRAQRILEVWAEKAARLAEVCERRALRAGSRAPIFRAEARRLRGEGERYAGQARRCAPALTAPPRPGLGGRV
jgi:hypothetical protein